MSGKRYRRLSDPDPLMALQREIEQLKRRIEELEGSEISTAADMTFDSLNLGSASGAGTGALIASGTIRSNAGFNTNGTAGLASQVVVLAAITGGGTNGSITVTGGIVTAYVAPT